MTDRLPAEPADRPLPVDRSNGWDAVAPQFIEQRARSQVGVSTVAAWARSLPKGAAILDLGCGSGVPIAEALVRLGFMVHGIDASPTMVAAFRQRFPGFPVACEPAEDSVLFDRTFDAALAIGLLFLLPPDVQRRLILRAAGVLTSGGRFLFTAPVEAGSWSDLSTGWQSVSLGDAEYRRLIAEVGLVVVGEYRDEGGNHYYDAARLEAPAVDRSADTVTERI
jgi:SAM-dependent methyltransferase